MDWNKSNEKLSKFLKFYLFKNEPLFIKYIFSISIYDLCPTSWPIPSASSIELLEFGIEKILKIPF